MNHKIVIFLTGFSSFLFCNLQSVDGTFPFGHALGGFVTDIATNPLGILVFLVLKKLILLKLGLLLFHGKRSIEAYEPNQQVMINSTLVIEYEKMATGLDVNGCMAKLICEVMASEERKTMFEKAIGKYFSSLTAEQFSQTPPSAPGHSIFHYAAFMGKLAKNPESCGLIFQKCTTNMNEVKKTADIAFAIDI